MDQGCGIGFSLVAVLGILLGGCAASDGSGSGIDPDAASRAETADGQASDKTDATVMDGVEDAAREAGADSARPDGDGGRVCAMTETCDNGLDDDCDGEVDESCACLPGAMQRCYLASPETAGIGQCRHGMQRCAGTGEFGSWTPCEGAQGPGPELCDMVDNDCDGVVDNNCACRAGDLRGCYAGPAETRGIGACRDGAQLCFAGPGGVGSAWGMCTGGTLPGMEMCDGVDNDCNGTVDDGCGCTAGESRRCYGGPEGTEGRGPCRAGTQRCVVGMGGRTAWGACEMQTLPGPERCDGEDNDCDGTVDDGCACRMGETRPCYDGPMGTRGVAPCADGTQACVLGAGGIGSSWGPCLGQRLPTAELCDDVDNNCNGAVDDGCACRRGESRACYTGPTGTQGVGSCRAGTQGCNVAGGVASFGPCMGQTLPGMEQCGDGLDNNCNGAVDDGCVCRAGESRPCYTGPMGTLGVGSCRAGSQACAVTAGVASFGACMGQVGPGTEVCGDGLDNNCNGMVDDGCVCRAGESRPCYLGPMGTQGVGVCRAGSQTCTVTAGVASFGACTGPVGPGTEVCGDGLDNDCDGMVDEGCACTLGASQACYSGPAGTQGVGLCRAGSQSCVVGPGGVGSAWGACSGARLPTPELCDGLDNDCNGMVDNGCACIPGAMESCYSGPSGTQGVGSCRAGSRTCVAGPGGVGSAWGACTGETLPRAETCNLVDDNCNGTVDDGCACIPGAMESCYSGPAGTQGVGSCRAGTRTCVAGPGGVGSAWGACTGETLPRAETCNMVDDNCNAMVDEGISCSGPSVTCPAPVTAPAGTTVTLTATATGAASYRWELVSGPRGGTVTFGSPTSARTTFTSVIVGVYTVRITVTDASGRTATCTTTVTLQGHGLRVELVWDTGTMAPVTAGRTDLDLHLHNRLATNWFDDPNDCFYANRAPRWDVRGSTADDPSLDVDNVYGFGPENIRVDAPVVTSQTYSVGVHYFFGDVRSNATVRIYCGDVLVGTYNRALNGGPILGGSNDFWRVARVVFSSPSACAVTRVDDVITFTQARTGNP